MWSEKCFIVSGTATNQVPTLSIIDTKFYVPIITLSTQDNVDLLQQLKSGFKRAINWNKYQWKVSIQKQSQYLDNLIDSYFHGIIDFLFYHLKIMPTEQATSDIYFQL